jgi:UDP-4-amino-4,6-dideoxy-N-acetyl-beta-L-altrosamine transaminase
VRDQWLPYGHHRIEEDDVAAVLEVLHSDWITQGPKVELFERAVADSCDAKYGVAFASGTAALHAACRVAQLGPGDQAITTPLTFVATANAIVYCGAEPRFADIEENSFNIDPAEIQKQITPKTKVLLPVDFAGHPVELERIVEIAHEHGLKVIEDASHALGAKYRGRPIGSIADMTVFSFHPVKQITTGEGGIVLTGDREFSKRLKTFRHHGIECPDPEHPWNYEIRELGHNYRISDLQCALGLSQLRRLNERIVRKREIALRYQDGLASIEEVSLPVTASHVEHAWHIFVVLLNLEKLAADRDTILKALRSENIGATWHYPLVHLLPFYREKFGYGEGLCPVAERHSNRMITLPLFSAMSDDDAEDVIEATLKVLDAYR